MKQIEPGCTAMILGVVPENMGMIVTVGKYLGSQESTVNGCKYITQKAWQVNKPVLTNFGHTHYYTHENTLNRIDEDDETQTIEENEETEI